MKTLLIFLLKAPLTLALFYIVECLFHIDHIHTMCIAIATTIINDIHHVLRRYIEN